MEKKKYVHKFSEWLSTGKPITNTKGEVLQIQQNEEFRPTVQVEYWFVSNHGNVVSVYGKMPLWLTPGVTPEGREQYKHKKKNYASYTLVAAAFPNSDYACCEDRTTAVHHTKKFSRNATRAENNNPEYLQEIPVDLHRAIHRISSLPSDAERTPECSEAWKDFHQANRQQEPLLLFSGHTCEGFDSKGNPINPGFGEARICSLSKRKLNFTQQGWSEFVAIQAIVNHLLDSK